MDDNSILNLMIKDHEKIINFINEIESKDHFDIDLFSSFKWHLEKHIFTEEKAIFSSYRLDKNNDSDQTKSFEQLSKEHTVILGLIDKILRENLPSGNINFGKLKKLLNKHRNFEEEKIYPKLDENLTISDKNRIIQRIKDMM